ncbi:hypothetical protein Q31b_32170 [Novipirellula aureliae]|uniref:Uncharacterized protein n=1 Tax=Novipirellula aureliae TaxID=2527966 RepID=A0A5C6DWZ2_9BACT|nr:hypothetical protein [Novipirellula aureliae]TWU39901.1 hypothetical protein Q31b_32170 [Novipirellula aureliae]
MIAIEGREESRDSLHRSIQPGKINPFGNVFEPPFVAWDHFRFTIANTSLSPATLRVAKSAFAAYIQGNLFVEHRTAQDAPNVEQTTGRVVAIGLLIYSFNA